MYRPVPALTAKHWSLTRVTAFPALFRTDISEAGLALRISFLFWKEILKSSHGRDTVEPFEMSWSRPPRARELNRLVCSRAAAHLEDVFVCCTRFLRMYIHCVSSRHWPSPDTTHPPRCCEDRARLVADKLANRAKSRKMPPGPRHRDSDYMYEAQVDSGWRQVETEDGFKEKRATLFFCVSRPSINN